MEQEDLRLVLPGEILGYHERQAAHFRELASIAPGTRVRLSAPTPPIHATSVDLG